MTVPTRIRRRRFALPIDPSEEELVRDWTLSDGDRDEVRRCRGASNRLRFALQLCVFRRYGRFLSDFATVPIRLANHLGRQLDHAPVLFMEQAVREATDLDHERRIRKYLGFQKFTVEVQQRLDRELAEQASAGKPPTELLVQAEEILCLWKVVLPAPSTLERLVGSIVARVQAEAFQRIRSRLPQTFCDKIDELLRVSAQDSRSLLFRLKEYPPESTPATILSYIERFRLVQALGTRELALADLNPARVQSLAQLAKHYDADDLKRFPADKRYGFLACFLAEAQKTLLDHLVAMHQQFLTGMSRRARRAFEARYKEVRRQIKTAWGTVLAALELVIDPAHPHETVLTTLYGEFSEEELRQALSVCRAFQRFEDRGYLDHLRSRHPHLKRYLPALLHLPFQGAPGTAILLRAMEIARQVHADELKGLPDSVPLQFVPGGWRRALFRKDGRIDQPLWEIALAFAVRDALRSGDLYLSESRHHVSFWNLVYDANRWTEERPQAYLDLNLPREGNEVLIRLQVEFDQAAAEFGQGLPENPFVQIRDGQLKLRQPDALPVPERVRALRRVILTHLPRVRIETLLLQVDAWCQFSRALAPLGQGPLQTEKYQAALLAAVVAHGANLGIATMAQSTAGVSTDTLRYVSHWCLRPETFKAANQALVDYHHQLPLSSVWGEGIASSSDGQRFGIEASSLLASFYPRYFGYYERAISVYSHISDQYSVFASQAISCSPREALYVLDGLLENETLLRPREHYTDTHGFTEQLFGLCYLLGYSFMPRLKDLPDHQLYKLDEAESCGGLDTLLRQRISTDLIREQWDQLVRVATSLRNRTAPAHVILERLAGSGPSDRLAKALTALGRLVKTIYLLRYLHDPQIRRRVQLQLNRGEVRHKLARWLFFANQGIFRTGDYEEIMNKVSALSVLSNAVLVWNTIQIAQIIELLSAQEESVSRDDLARVSPLAHAHVISNGTYDFTQTVNLAETVTSL